MYVFLTLLTGNILSLMVLVNGKLSEKYGSLVSAFIIHIVGFLFSFLLCMILKKFVKPKRSGPLWMYFGGALGTLTTVFQNFAYGKLGITNILALALLGQGIFSAVIDIFGLFGMKKRPFERKNLPAIFICFLGIFFLFDKNMSLYAAVSILLSFLSGFVIVISRTFNARLSENSNPFFSSMFAHFTGMIVTFLMAFLFSGNNFFIRQDFQISNWWIYTGGIMGVLVIFLSNITVIKISAVSLTFLIFAGQVVFAVILDIFLGNPLNSMSFAGSMTICFGIFLNYLTDFVSQKIKIKS